MIKEERRQITKAGMKQNFTTNSADIKRTVSGYYEQLNTHTFDNSGETDQFLEKQQLPQLNPV